MNDVSQSIAHYTVQTESNNLDKIIEIATHYSKQLPPKTKQQPQIGSHETILVNLDMDLEYMFTQNIVDMEVFTDCFYGLDIIKEKGAWFKKRVSIYGETKMTCKYVDHQRDYVLGYTSVKLDEVYDREIFNAIEDKIFAALATTRFYLPSLITTRYISILYLL